MRKIKVDLGSASYHVAIGAGILSDPHLFPIAAQEKVAIIADANVFAIHGASLQDTLARAGVTAITTITQAPGERTKSWQALMTICDLLTANKLDRNAWVVALGGGVISDLAGFVAAVYLRGIRYLSVPTSLLAQVDASIGGKVAINTTKGKNLVGAIYQPMGVITDITTCQTMPEREFRAGLAEVVKHGLLDNELFEFLDANQTELAKGTQAEPDFLTELVVRNVECKARHVSQDVNESGVRMHLNLGHTFAHALEAALDYETLLHGEAVAIGLVAACNLSARLGHAASDLEEKVAGLLKKLGLPIRMPDVDPDAFFAAMIHDKKSMDGKCRFVLPRQPGAMLVTADVNEDAVAATVRDLGLS